MELENTIISIKEKITFKKESTQTGVIFPQN